MLKIDVLWSWLGRSGVQMQKDLLTDLSTPAPLVLSVQVFWTLPSTLFNDHQMFSGWTSAAR